MRDFNFKKSYNELLSSEIVNKLSVLHEYKVKQDSYEGVKQDVLTKLVEIAKIQSTEASNRIEGIVTTSDRLNKIVKQKTMPKNRSEKEIAGYRDALATVHESYAYIPPKPSLILQLHRDLLKYTGKPAGVYKSSDNYITEEKDGKETIRFTPVPAWETPDTLKNLCEQFEIALSDTDMDPLILIPIFILDFLCIHPFSDGNGRMSRLLTLLLLYRAGYSVGKYISIERIIADTKETYYEELLNSSNEWYEGKNKYSYFVDYMLGVLIGAYKDFESRVQIVVDCKLSKMDRVREIIKNKLGKITKQEIIEQCPDISETTVERALSYMLDNNDIIKIKGGRYTEYIWNNNKE